MQSSKGASLPEGVSPMDLMNKMMQLYMSNPKIKEEMNKEFSKLVQDSNSQNLPRVQNISQNVAKIPQKPPSSKFTETTVAKETPKKKQISPKTIVHCQEIDFIQDMANYVSENLNNPKKFPDPRSELQKAHDSELVKAKLPSPQSNVQNIFNDSNVLKITEPTKIPKKKKSAKKVLRKSETKSQKNKALKFQVNAPEYPENQDLNSTIPRINKKRHSISHELNLNTKKLVPLEKPSNGDIDTDLIKSQGSKELVNNPEMKKEYAKMLNEVQILKKKTLKMPKYSSSGNLNNYSSLAQSRSKNNSKGSRSSIKHYRSDFSNTDNRQIRHTRTQSSNLISRKSPMLSEIAVTPEKRKTREKLKKPLTPSSAMKQARLVSGKKKKEIERKNTQKFEELEKLSKVSDKSSKTVSVSGEERETSKLDTSQFFDSKSIKSSQKYLITNPNHLRSSTKYHPLIKKLNRYTDGKEDEPNKEEDMHFYSTAKKSADMPVNKLKYSASVKKFKQKKLNTKKSGRKRNTTAQKETEDINDLKEFYAKKLSDKKPEIKEKKSHKSYQRPLHKRSKSSITLNLDQIKKNHFSNASKGIRKTCRPPGPSGKIDKGKIFSSKTERGYIQMAHDSDHQEYDSDLVLFWTGGDKQLLETIDSRIKKATSQAKQTSKTGLKRSKSSAMMLKQENHNVEHWVEEKQNNELLLKKIKQLEGILTQKNERIDTLEKELTLYKGKYEQEKAKNNARKQEQEVANYHLTQFNLESDQQQVKNQKSSQGQIKVPDTESSLDNPDELNKFISLNIKSNRNQFNETTNSLSSQESMETTRTISTTPMKQDKTLEQVQKIRKSLTNLHHPRYSPLNRTLEESSSNFEDELENLEDSIVAKERKLTDTGQQVLSNLKKELEKQEENLDESLTQMKKEIFDREIDPKLLETSERSGRKLNQNLQNGLLDNEIDPKLLETSERSIAQNENGNETQNSPHVEATPTNSFKVFASKHVMETPTVLDDENAFSPSNNPFLTKESPNQVHPDEQQIEIAGEIELFRSQEPPSESTEDLILDCSLTPENQNFEVKQNYTQSSNYTESERSPITNHYRARKEERKHSVMREPMDKRYNSSEKDRSPNRDRSLNNSKKDSKFSTPKVYTKKSKQREEILKRSQDFSQESPNLKDKMDKTIELISESILQKVQSMTGKSPQEKAEIVQKEILKTLSQEKGQLNQKVFDSLSKKSYEGTQMSISKSSLPPTTPTKANNSVQSGSKSHRKLNFIEKQEDEESARESSQRKVPFRLDKVNPLEYDYNVNQFYQDYLTFLQHLESKKVVVSEKITLENGREVIIYTNGVKKVQLKNKAYRTVIFFHFHNAHFNLYRFL